MQNVNPSLVARDQTIIAQIGRDMRLLIGRINQLERDNRTTQPPEQLPTLMLPTLVGLQPANFQGSTADLGFIDLKLALADWSQWDLLYDGQDLNTESSLHSAILVSVWTDARVGDEGGWWGDSFSEKPIAESKLWTLLGKPANDDNVALGSGYVKTALQWLLADKWITELSVSGEAQQDPNTHLDIFAFRVDHTDRSGVRRTLYL